jgi:serine/threonine protein kinase
MKDRFQDTFVLERSLSNTKHSQVFIASLNNNPSKKVIIKKIPTDRWYKNIQREISAGNILSKCNIIAKLLEHFEQGDYTYLVFEYVPGLDLYEYMAKKNFQPIQEDTVRNIIKQLLRALRFSHKNGIAHMDIKLENIILIEKKKKVKLIDFGLCEVISEHCERFCGTRDYAPPEILQRKPYSTPIADVWCLGIVAFILLYGLVRIFKFYI